MQAPFVFVKVSDYGTSTPVVARTVHQAHHLLKLFPVTEEFRRQVTQVMWEVQRHLLECYKTSEEICREIHLGQTEFEGRAGTVGDSGETPTPPWVMDLESRLESFLYSAKLALRDTGAILTLFFGQDFGHRFDRALRWAKEHFGEDDSLVRVLEAHDPWVKEVIDMRNAVEHPADVPRRHLHVQNFSLRLEHEGSRFVAAEPIWWLEGDPPSPIAQDLPVVVGCLLRLSEEVYAYSLIKMDTPIAVEIIEIPEVERNPDAPVRFNSVVG